MPLNKNSDSESIAVVLTKEQIEYLKKKGINRSAFMRQAIDACRNGVWEYIY